MAGDLIQNLWKDDLKRKYPQYFQNIRALDVGSADINGINKPWFTNCEYIGLDVLPYKNVDVVSVAHEYDAPLESFDNICSTSSLEHDMHWDKTLKKMVELLKPGGFMWFTASHTCGKHGTRKCAPLDSLTVQLPDSTWPDYFGEITIEMVRSVIDLDKIFEKYEIFYRGNDTTQLDLYIYFWGIKRSTNG